jgi:ATP-binding protein involved in chromosome partitioning
MRGQVRRGAALPERIGMDAKAIGAAVREAAGERVSGVTLRNGTAGLVLSIDGLAKGDAEALQQKVEGAAIRAGARQVRVILTAERGEAPREPLPLRILAVASGKGGVGKSTVSANLAVALAAQGLGIGLLDADIYGPSVPTLLGVPGRARMEENRIVPMEAFGIKALSMGMLTDPGRAVVWRGPMASSALEQMVTQGNWGELDLMVADMPPGTGDIQLTMAQKLKPVGAIVVSTPQDLALVDARRAIAMFREVGVPVLGIVENMSWFDCPHCGGRTEPFGHGGARDEAKALGVPFLGAIPLNASIRAASDAGRPPALEAEGGTFRDLAERVRDALRI